MRIDILTLFPQMFTSVLGSSILKRAADPAQPLAAGSFSLAPSTPTAAGDSAHPRDPSGQSEADSHVVASAVDSHAADSNSDSQSTPGSQTEPSAASVAGASMNDASGGRVSYHVTDIRDFTTNKHQKVDRPPFGGGPGMVMQCQPVWDAVMAVEAMDARPATRILLTPQGERLTQPLVEELARQPRLLMIAGHYEGIDERVIEALAPMREISIGDYVLTGGELPAMVLIDAVVRLIPGVLGHEESAHHDSFSPGAHRLLDHPHYTRPREWQGREVPPILLSGDHAAVEKWRKEQAMQRTKERRPDLLGE